MKNGGRKEEVLPNPNSSKRYLVLAGVVLLLAVIITGISCGLIFTFPNKVDFITIEWTAPEPMASGALYWNILGLGEICDKDAAKACISRWYGNTQPDIELDYFVPVEPCPLAYIPYVGFVSRFELVWVLNYGTDCRQHNIRLGAEFKKGERWDLYGASMIYRPNCLSKPGDSPPDSIIVDCPLPPEIRPHISGPDIFVVVCNNRTYDIEILQMEATTTGQTRDVPLDSLFFGDPALESLPFTELVTPGKVIPAGDSAVVDVPDEPISGNYYCKIAYREVNSPYEPLRVVYKTTIPETPIPTLTEWGLLIFGLLLAGFMSWIALRRRKSAVVQI
jgi:hypothetical protein